MGHLSCSSYFYYRETSSCSCQLPSMLLRRYFKSGYSVWHSLQTLVSMVKKEDVGIIYLLQPCVHTRTCVCFLYRYCEHHTMLPAMPLRLHHSVCLQVQKLEPSPHWCHRNLQYSYWFAFHPVLESIRALGAKSTCEFLLIDWHLQPKDTISLISPG